MNKEEEIAVAEDTVRVASEAHALARRSTEDILDHHLEAFQSGDLSDILEDYTNESIIISPDGAVLRGPEEITPLFEAFIAEFAKPGASFSLGQRVIDRETAYITWSAETADNVYELGTDTFWIHDGKILTHTFAVKARPKA